MRWILRLETKSELLDSRMMLKMDSGLKVGAKMELSSKCRNTYERIVMIICIILKLPDLKNFISTDILLSQNVTYGCCQGSVWPSVPIWEACDTNLPKVIYLLHLRDLHLPTRDARPAPPRPGQKRLPRPAPTPKNFNTAPPRPGPKKR